MQRDLYLHHYLPAHLASCLVAGAYIDFLFSDPLVGRNKSKQEDEDHRTPASPLLHIDRAGDESLVGDSPNLWAFAIILVALLGMAFYYFSPLTYGLRSLSTSEWNARRWLMSWEIDFYK